MAALTLVTAPTSEPVTIQDVTTHCRIDATDEYPYLDGLISAARTAVENFIHRSLMPQTWALRLDYFPWCIQLQRPPITAVSSITYLDTASVLQTVSSSVYTADIYHEPGRITPIFGQIWPVPLPQINAVTVTYTAGYADADSVPMPIKQAILMMVANMYENREPVAVGTVAAQIPMSAEYLLNPYRIVEF